MHDLPGGFNRRTALCSLAAAFPAFAADPSPYWPDGSNWESVSPSSAGMDENKLNAALDYCMNQNSVSALVLRQGRIVAERYGSGWNQSKPHTLASATKSMTAIVVGTALEEGKLRSLNQSLADFVPSLKGTPKEAITLQHLLTMTSGLDPAGVDPATTAGDQLIVNSAMKLAAPPGTKWAYNTPAYHLLFRIVERATGESWETYSRRKLFGPLGMENYLWQKYKVGDVVNYYRIDCSARDMARFGLLCLRSGQWRRRQLINRGFFQQAITPSQELNPAYGLLFWLNQRPGFLAGEGDNEPRPATRRFPAAPHDTFAALGAMGQAILVIPSRDLVVIRQGRLARDATFLGQFLNRVLSSLT